MTQESRKLLFAIKPPVGLNEKAIADFLDYETAKIDALIQKVETGLDQLQEYRAALITAAVTGKIDVRKAAGQETGEKAA
ncbi:MAG: hypothetical protein H6862_01315 [Rhodospirillales bacterium]|nr:hypothetical protein [Rhodospirillales bacterium]